MSGPDDLIGSVQHLRQLGQGWSSRLLQRVLLNLLTDPTASQEVADAREEYAERRARFASLLAENGVVTEGADGLNLWVPVHDETAAIMRLAVSGVAVAPGRPFQVGTARLPTFESRSASSARTPNNWQRSSPRLREQVRGRGRFARVRTSPSGPPRPRVEVTPAALGRRQRRSFHRCYWSGQ